MKVPSAQTTITFDESREKAQIDLPSIPRICAKDHSLSMYLGTRLCGSTLLRKVMPIPAICLFAVAEEVGSREKEAERKDTSLSLSAKLSLGEGVGHGGVGGSGRLCSPTGGRVGAAYRFSPDDWSNERVDVHGALV